MAKVTIDDVAELAGVSIKTVSRVVNQEPNVRESTRDKVVKAIAELDYRPNHSARSLAGRRSYLVGLLYTNISAAYLMALQEGALKVCQSQGYGLLIDPYQRSGESTAQDMLDQISRWRLDGVLLAPPLSEQREITEILDANGICYVPIAAEKPTGSDYVHCDDRQAAADMTEHLLELGHRRIGFIIGSSDHGSSRERLRGYRDALTQAGIELEPELQVQGDYTFDSGRACAEQLLQLKNPPTAIFAGNDDMAAGVMIAARERSLDIPNELSIVGFDDTPAAEQMWPPLTTVRQPVRELAEHASELLLNKLRGRSEGSSEVALRCSLEIRQSTMAV